MKIVIPGGSGHVGACLVRYFQARGDQTVVLSRSGAGGVVWDGKTLGDWVQEVDGADAVINLAGRSVNCRYTEENLREMMESRVLSTRAVARAIAACDQPPRVWLQASTATIYAHRLDAANDEATGIIGGDEPDVPEKWRQSIEIAKAWEAELDAAETPQTRKVALRSAMTMSPDKGSIFDTLHTLTKRGLGGTIGSGKQFVSWIHERDFCRAVDWLTVDEKFSGPVNLASPNPLPQAEFQRVLREKMGAGFGLPTPAWMAEIGAAVMGTETEMILKSRRVIPGRLLDAGFEFEFPEWDAACADLLERSVPG